MNKYIGKDAKNMKVKDPVDNIKKEKKKERNTAWIGAVAVLLIIGILLGIKVNKHFSVWAYYTRPVLPGGVQFPIGRILVQETEETAPFVEGQEVVMDIDAIVEKAQNPAILRGVHMLESTRGKNDGCLDDGLVNGFGYRQNSREFVCYSDFRTVASKVDQWFTNRLAENGNNLAEALCYYNTGIADQYGCKYSTDFLTVVEL